MYVFDNADRAERANQILASYQDINSDMGDEDDPGAVFGYLLADIRHYCQQNNINFEGALLVSEVHFEQELSEEGIDGAEHVEANTQTFEESLQEANEIASGKTVELANPSQEHAFQGVYLGRAGHHAVFSLGRTAKIFELDKLGPDIAKLVSGQEVGVHISGGIGVLSFAPEPKGIER